MELKVSVFHGDIAEAPADAVCTSTNTRLTLMMGTGGAVRERGGFSILRQCEAIVANGPVPAGSAHVTSAGTLPYKAIIHCVASDPSTHVSSDSIIRACVRNALARADELGIRTLAMPVFATGHARFKFDRALSVMLGALREATTNVESVLIAVHEAERAVAAESAVRAASIG